MRRVLFHSVSKSLSPFPAKRCQRRRLGALAQQPALRSRPVEPIPISHDPSKARQQSDPYALVAPELTYIRKNMLNLLGSAHPGLSHMGESYYLEPSKHLRSLLVLLFSRATNGLGRQWECKQRDAAYELRTNQRELFDRPLKLSNVLNEWNPSMPDHTESFESVFLLQRPAQPPSTPPSSPRKLTSRPRLVSPPLLLPTQLRLAQIVEMIHVASSLHEAITKSPEGGGKGSENKLSILGGDFLLGRASTALSRLGESEVVELVASVISNVAEGQFLSMDEIRTPKHGLIQGPMNLTSAWELYLRKTYLKTASLMAKGARSAVILGGSQADDVWKEVAYVYGRNLGIAYQLLEDAADFANIRPGLANGPILFACEESPGLLPLIQRNLTLPGDIELAIGYVQESSGVERTRLLAEGYASRAREVLQHLPDSDSRHALEELIEIVVNRTW